VSTIVSDMIKETLSLQIHERGLVFSFQTHVQPLYFLHAHMKSRNMHNYKYISGL
jgi:hypothetical protein